jgi:hypothetical protein
MLVASSTTRVNSELFSDYNSGTLTKEKVRMYFKNSIIAIGEYLYWMETFGDENNNEEMPTLD